MAALGIRSPLPVSAFIRVVIVVIVVIVAPAAAVQSIQSDAEDVDAGFPQFIDGLNERLLARTACIRNQQSPVNLPPQHRRIGHHKHGRRVENHEIRRLRKLFDDVRHPM